MLLAVSHSATGGWTKVEDLTSLSDIRARADTLIWAEASVHDLSETDVKLIAEEFDLDAFAVEDSLNTRQRPKFEPYPTHLFAVFHQLDEHDGQFEATQLACFIGENYVVTIHDGADRVIEKAKDRWSKMHFEREHPSLLLHTLVDVVVDEYQELTDALETDIEELEEEILADPQGRSTVTPARAVPSRGRQSPPEKRQFTRRLRLYSSRQRLGRLRRYVTPGVELLAWVTHPAEDSPFSEETGRHFRDVRDHLVRISEQVRNLESLTQALIDFLYAEQGQELNEVNRKLTAWAAIFAVGTLIAGIYGMNFALVPRDQSLFGFWFALSLMVGLSAVLFVYFKKRGWL